METQILSRRKSPLITVQPTQIKQFDLQAGAWTTLIALNSKIQVDWSSSLAFLDGGHIMICGGGKDGKAALNSAYVLSSTGVVWKLPAMRSTRWGHGVVYFPELSRILVFGGSNLSNEKLKCCEEFQLSASRWSNLPNMHDERSWFTPVLHSSVVYLCGGCPALETYTPASNIFTVLTTLPQHQHCIATISGQDVLVISDHFVCTWNIQQRQVQNCLEHSTHSVWSSCPAFAQGSHVLLISEDRRCLTVNSETGELEREVEFH